MREQPTREADEIFCPSCGQIIKRDAAACPYCGVPIRHIATPGEQTVCKDRTIALILAIFLGFWTWLYTYDADSWKFWTNLGLTIVTCGVWSIAAWIWAIVDVAIRPDTFYHNYPYG
jgi:DNA-directed RNA polymerase subunit RPC12/RpoP